MQPCGKGRVVTELGDSLEGADESELREVACELVLPGQTIGKAIDAVHVGFVQLALGSSFACDHPRNQLSFVQAASRLCGNRKRRHLLR